jgi:hypothetical protein
MTNNRMQIIKILLSVGVDKLPRGVGAPASMALTLLLGVSSFVSEGADLFIMS